MYVFNNDGVVKFRGNACSTDKSQCVVLNYIVMLVQLASLNV
jgi:hypothetical protein